MLTKRMLLTSLVLCYSSMSIANENVLGGIEGLACEAIICLSHSSGGSYSQCSPSLNHYFDIKEDKMSKTIKERLKFLQKCPYSGASPEMKSLVNAMASGAGRCDAASLNRTLLSWSGLGSPMCISSQLPAYCSAYSNHEYTIVNAPKYVVNKTTNNYWPYQNAFGTSSFFGATSNTIGIGNTGTSRNSCGKWVDQ